MHVYVGLSGGVDSAVSAALLKEQGHTVTGCFIKIWQPEFTECTWREDRLDAMRICAALQIPYKEIDLSDEYKKEVISDMLSNYVRGLTPNPDVLCNKKIKFGFFADWAFQSGADMVATGHYAQIKETPVGLALTRGADPDKDQSYFLWQLSQSSLSRILFPVGHLTKKQVRKEAARLQLPVATKHDSQGLCFVGAITLPEFLAQYIDLTKGDVVSIDGERIGEHDGAALYTIGQRHGFTHNTREPQYVVRVDINSNTLVVSPSIQDAHVHRISIHSPHWLLRPNTFPCSLHAQVRYRETPFIVSLSDPQDGQVTFSQPHIASKGQSIVLYDKDIVVGGGIIESTVRHL